MHSTRELNSMLVCVGWMCVSCVRCRFSLSQVYMIHMCNYPYVMWFLTLAQNLCLETHNKRSKEEKMIWKYCPVNKRQTTTCLVLLKLLNLWDERTHRHCVLCTTTLSHTREYVRAKLFGEIHSFHSMMLYIWFIKHNETPIDIVCVVLFFSCTRKLILRT